VLFVTGLVTRLGYRERESDCQRVRVPTGGISDAGMTAMVLYGLASAVDQQ